MKYLLTTIMLISFVGIAVFGFVFWASGMNEHNADCITSPIDGTPCPVSIVGMTLQHISTLQNFSQALVPSTVLLLLVALFSLAISFHFLLKNLISPSIRFSFQRRNDPAKFHSQQKIISWLSLLENSPAF